MKLSPPHWLPGLLGISALTSVAETDTPQQLPGMIVEAQRAKQSLTAPTADESREQIQKTPGGVETVDAERFLSGRASTVADTFALSPGVFAQSRFGSDEARLSIRGSGLQRTFHGRGLRLLQDGVPLNLADGGFDFQALDPLATDHIDVWRGGNALTYGSSTLGGAIDYVSRNGRNFDGGIARLEAGSYGYLRAAIASGTTIGQGDVFASFSQQQQEGFRDHAEQNNQRFFANAGYRFNDDVETRFYLNAINTVSELPGYLTKAELERDPQLAAPSNLTLDQHRDFELLRLANKTTVRNGSTTWEFVTGWTHKDLDHPISTAIDQNTSDFLLGAIATDERVLFGHDNRLRAGMFYHIGITDAASYKNVNGYRGALLNGADQSASNVEGFLEDQFALGHGFTAVVGASAAYNRRENERTFWNGVNPAPAVAYTNEYTNLSPKIGMRWDGPGLQVFGNISGSYEPPSFSEALTANTPREAQKGTTFEIGTRGAHRFVRWDVAAYTSQIENELLSVDHDLNPATPAVTFNTNRSLHRGIELGSEIDLFGQDWSTDAGDRLVLRDAWTWGDFRFDNDVKYGDNQIAGLPQHLIRGELMWEHRGGWYAGPTFEWVPVKAFIDHRNTFAADPYALCGFKFGQRQADGLSWFVEVRNLTDEQYAATTGVIENANGTDQRQFLPGDGRSVFAGVEWRW